jgi:hypothetical protein
LGEWEETINEILEFSQNSASNTENPRVAGSIPALGTFTFKSLANIFLTSKTLQ